MPSKTKKHSKAMSRLSNGDGSASPRTPSVAPSPFFEVSEDDVLCSLEEAASKFPALIGKSAFIGKVTDVERDSKSCKIWLSETSMVASSLAPGSTVSVSLAAFSRKKISPSFPLSSLADECAEYFGVDTGEKVAHEVGNYFALATVFPSTKVLKNEVRLSSNLSYTLGCPTSGCVVCVYPIQSQFLPGLANGSDKPNAGRTTCLSVYNCKELYLELAPSKNRLTVKSNMLSSMNFPAEKAHDIFENGEVSSPKTPLHQSKLTSSSTRHSTSAICEESVSGLSNPNSSSVDSFDIREVLGDESAKKLLQKCATTWLHSRNLLCGNLVAIPLLSELFIFRVIDAKKLSAKSSNQDLKNEGTHDLLPEDSELVDHVNRAFLINRDTKVCLYLPLNATSETPQKRGLSSVGLECKDGKANVGDNTLKLGGLSKEYAALKNIIISSLVKKNLSRYGLRTTKGVLLHGPPGTGKTSLVRLCAHDAGIKLFSVNGPEIVRQFYGESEKALHEVFDSASQAAPAVVFIDELDAIAPARKEGGEELSQRMVATLLNLMDGINRTDGIIVIAATNRPDSIEPALRRPGRLDREIEIGVPSPKQRLDILLTLLSEMEHSLLDMQVQHLAMVTHGFVGADLAALCTKAGLVCHKRYVKSKYSHDLYSGSTSSAYEGCSDGIMEESYCLEGIRDISREYADSATSAVSDLAISSEIQLALHLTGTVSENADNITDGIEEDCRLRINFEDFEKAKMKVKPSAMREAIIEVPNVNWKDVGGEIEIKNQIKEVVEWPQKYQDDFKRIGVHPPRGVLLFGPPGCSKTLLARAVASEAGLNFLSVKGPELFSKWVGESEKAVRSLFAKARANAPSIIFFDEIDSLAVIRGKESDGVSVSDRVMSQLLVEMDGLHQRVDVTVIAATNRPDNIDPALLRPGRFDRKLYVRPPNKTDREEIFRIHLRKHPCSSDISINELASLTEGYTGADISSICRAAAIAAMEEDFNASEITMQHLKIAIRQEQPSDIQSCIEISEKFQRRVQTSATENELGFQQCSSKSNRLPTWKLIKSAASFLYRFLAALSRTKSASCG